VKLRTGLIAFVALVAMGSLLALSARSQSKYAEVRAPDVLDVGRLDISIVDAVFVKKLDAVNAQFEESKPDTFHGLVLTLKVEKPADDPLTLYGQDLSLHYRHGEKTDVLPCQGVSGFSSSLEVDRPMQLSQSGYVSSTTGVQTRKADAVYVDVFFQYLEPDTTDVHLLVAQPVGASFETDGWQPEGE
jgi:hypothetical protein